jgi:hypothetical protein
LDKNKSTMFRLTILFISAFQGIYATEGIQQPSPVPVPVSPPQSGVISVGGIIYGGSIGSPAQQPAAPPNPANPQGIYQQPPPPPIVGIPVVVNPRKILSAGVVNCFNNPKGEAIASFVIQDLVVSSQSSAMSAPSSANGGLASFTVTFDNPGGSEWFFVAQPNDEGPLDSIKYGANAKLENKKWTFNEIEGQSIYGGEIKFLNVKSCINGVLSPPVTYKVSALINGIPIYIAQ